MGWEFQEGMSPAPQELLRSPHLNFKHWCQRISQRQSPSQGSPHKEYLHTTWPCCYTTGPCSGCGGG